MIINKMKGTLGKIIKADHYTYQSKIGTVDALLQLVDDITLGLDGTGIDCAQLASLDFSKAFGRLQPPIVTTKMKLHDFESRIINIISDFLQKTNKQTNSLVPCFFLYSTPIHFYPMLIRGLQQ